MNNTESLLTNKKFIKTSIVFVAILAVFFFAKFIKIINPNDISNSEMMNTISVTGEGEVSAVPDIAVINISISKEGKLATDATDALNEMIASTLSYLKEKEVADKDIKSEYGGINPKYERETVYCVTYPCPQGKTKIVAYTATQNINIKVRVADNANEIRSGLAELGITDISGPTFSIDDKSLLQEEAKAKAISDAKEKAEKLAKNLGVKLGKVVSFYEENEGAYPVVYSKANMGFGGDMESMTIQAPELPKGENKIFSRVNITYRIK